MVEARFPGIYWNPARWPTADGYIPFPVFDVYAAALFPALAMERLNLAQAIGCVVAKQDVAERIMADTAREVYQLEG